MADVTDHGNLDDSQAAEQENYWSTILNDVAASSARVGPSFSKTLLVLGNITSGKTTLIDKLCEISKTKLQSPNGIKLNGCSLEYRYIDVRDEDVEDSIAYMDVWLLDGVEYQEQLLQYVLSKEKCRNTIVVVVVDLSQPWDVMDSLQRWTEVVRTHLNTLNIPPKEFSEMRDAVLKHFQGYSDPEEPEISLSGDSASAATDPSVALPLDDSVLTHNLGIPLIVVCCKTDALDQVEKTHSYKSDHIDFVQQHIRRFCLNYGAGLVYTAAKDSKNISLLYKYLIHRAFGLPFRIPAHVVDKDAVFIPSGWDNENKIKILHKHIQQFDPDSDYSDIIKSQTITKITTERQDTSAQDDQVFLLTQKPHLDRTPTKAAPTAGGTAGISPSKGDAHHHKPATDSKLDTGDASGKPTPQAQDQKVLADFFNQLLAKRPAGSKSSSLVSSKSPSTENPSKKDKPAS